MRNIDELLRYCSMISYELPEIFARNNEKNERLFQFLRRAYINSRYDKDYSVCTNDLIVITKRLRVLRNNLKDLKFG